MKKKISVAFVSNAKENNKKETVTSVIIEVLTTLGAHGFKRVALDPVVYNFDEKFLKRRCARIVGDPISLRKKDSCKCISIVPVCSGSLTDAFVIVSSPRLARPHIFPVSDYNMKLQEILIREASRKKEKAAAAAASSDTPEPKAPRKRSGPRMRGERTRHL